MEQTIALGVVREGLVVPEGDEELPEGAIVEIRVISTKTEAQTSIWDRISAEQWPPSSWDD